MPSIGVCSIVDLLLFNFLLLSLTLSTCAGAISIDAAAAVPVIPPSLFLHPWSPTFSAADPLQPVYYVVDRNQFLTQLSSKDGSVLQTMNQWVPNNAGQISAIAVSPVDSSIYLLILFTPNSGIYHYAANNLSYIDTISSSQLKPVFPQSGGYATSIAIAERGKLMLTANMKVWIIDTQTNTQVDYWTVSGLPAPIWSYAITMDAHGSFYVQETDNSGQSDTGACYEFDIHGNAIRNLTLNVSEIRHITGMTVTDGGSIVLVGYLKASIYDHQGFLMRSLNNPSLIYNPQASYDIRQSRLLLNSQVGSSLFIYDKHGDAITTFSSTISYIVADGSLYYDRAHKNLMMAVMGDVPPFLALDDNGALLASYSLPSPYNKTTADGSVFWFVDAVSIHPNDPDTMAVLLWARDASASVCVLYSMSTEDIKRNFTVPYYGSNGYRRFLVYDADMHLVFTMNPTESTPTVRSYNAATGEFIASYSNSGFYIPQGMAQSAATKSDLYIASYHPPSVVRITYDGQPVGQPYRLPGYDNMFLSNLALDDLGNLYILGYTTENICIVQLSNSGSIIAEYDSVPKYSRAMKWMTVSGDGSILYAIDGANIALLEWNIPQESHPSLLNISVFTRSRINSELHK